MQAEASGRRHAKQIIDQLPCNGGYSSSTPVRVTILADERGWNWGSWKFDSTLTKELSKQLAKFPHVKVTVLVPEGSCNEIDKRDAESHNVTIVEAKKKPGFQNPNDWLCFPPKGLTTDIVIGVGERLCEMAQIFKELHHCKSIFVGCDSFEETFSRDAELRDAQAKMEDECLGKSNVQPMMQMADLPVAVGPKRAEKLSVSLSCQGKEVFKLIPGILSEFADVTQTLGDRRKFRILVAGHGHPRYFHKEGLDTVAKAVTGLKDRSYEIILVGAAKGEHRGFIEKFHECGVPKHQLIIRSPPKDEEEMKRWLCEADLAIVPSGEQEFGMFGLIALSSGLPILVHDASGLGEALTDVAGGSSSIVESEDISEWSKAIKKVRDKGRTLRLKEADSLRKDYNEVYSWEKQCGALVEEMLKMASGMIFFYVTCMCWLYSHIAVVKVKQCTCSLQLNFIFSVHV